MAAVVASKPAGATAAAASPLPPQAACPARFTGGAGDVTRYLTLEDGKITSCTAGKDETPGIVLLACWAAARSVAETGIAVDGVSATTITSNFASRRRQLLDCR